MAANVTKDMTEGSPVKLILGFFIPMLCGLLFQQLYNMADTIIVGKCLGVKALAAVGSTGSINFMIIGFCLGVCSGFAIPVAQKFGEKNEKALRRFVANSAWLAVLFSAVMTVAVCLLCRNILELMQTPEDIIDGAYSYIFVIFLGIPATYLYNLLSCTIRSLGDSTTPPDFSGVLLCGECGPGLLYDSGPQDGRVRGCLGHHHGPGSVGNPVPVLYEKEIRHP